MRPQVVERAAAPPRIPVTALANFRPLRQRGIGASNVSLRVPFPFGNMLSIPNNPRIRRWDSLHRSGRRA